MKKTATKEMMNMTVKELKSIAKELRIKGYYRMNKADLTQAINEAQGADISAPEFDDMASLDETIDADAVAYYEAREAELDRREAEEARNRAEKPALLKEAEELGLTGMEWLTADGIRKEIEKAKAEKAAENAADAELEKFWNEPINEMGTRLERIEVMVTMDVLGWKYEETENTITFTNTATGKKRTLHSYAATMDYIDMSLEGISPKTEQTIERRIKLEKGTELVQTAQFFNIQDAENMTDAELIECIRGMQRINEYSEAVKAEELENIIFKSDTFDKDDDEKLNIDSNLIWETLGYTRDMNNQDSFIYYWNSTDNSRVGFLTIQAAHQEGRKLLVDRMATLTAESLAATAATPEKVLAEPATSVPTITETLEEDQEKDDKLSELTDTITRMDSQIKDLKKVVQDLVQVIQDLKKPEPDPTPDKPDSKEEKAPEKGAEDGQDLKKINLEERGRAQADERMKAIGYTRVESPEGFEEMECYENDSTHKLKFFNSYGAALGYARKEEERRIDRKNKDMADREMKRRGYHPTRKPINGRKAYINQKTGETKTFATYQEVLEYVVLKDAKIVSQSDERAPKDKLHAEPKKIDESGENRPQTANDNHVVMVDFTDTDDKPTVKSIHNDIKRGKIQTVTLKAFTGMEIGEYQASSLMFDKSNKVIRLITKNGKKLDFDASGKQINAKKASYANTLIFNR